MIIRPALKKDLVECEKLLKIPELREATGEFIDADFLKNYLSPHYFLVAKDNKEIVGVAVGEKLKGKVGILWYLTVRKYKRNKGVGGQILNEFERGCKKQGIKWLVLFTPAFNKNTLAFYKKRYYRQGLRVFELEKKL